MANNIPLSELEALPGASALASPHGCVVVTRPEHWAHSVEGRLPLAGIEHEAQIVRVRLAVETGALGVGWLREDGCDWIALSSTALPDLHDVYLRIPAGAVGGHLVFTNWTAGGKAAVAFVESIEILAVSAISAVADKHFAAAAAAEGRGERDRAIAEYKAALAIYPLHDEAIAGLGRLRFIAPDQPFTAEMHRRIPAPIDICVLYIQVRNPCNFRCFYCVNSQENNAPVQRFDFEAITRVFDQIKAKLIVTAFDCGGGEPTLF